MTPIPSRGYGATGSVLSKLHPIDFERAAPKADELLIDILYCGVCHSDLHQVKNDWGNTIYPCVPGHEIIGRVREAGASVTKFKAGDIVGVGCMVDSCGTCAPCAEGEEQYCEGPKGCTLTYNGPMKPDGSNTYGGYSVNIVVKERFVLRIPPELAVERAAPILCAGVTTWSPLKHWKIGAGHQVAVVGLGGLGHMAVKLAKARGATVTVITTSGEKEAEAKALGADEVLLSTDKKAMEAKELSYHFILVTIPDPFDVNPYVTLLKRDGTLVTVGMLGAYKKGIDNNEVAFHRRSIAGSLIGGVAETQEVLDFCAQHGIQPDVELINMPDINDAFDRMAKGEVRFRYVIDMSSLEAKR
ncbi:NAD(P)-dependent alcohol dehydrogenase [Flaviaesturariibacter amylovorans]|uniref:NAD(P)-dependent alcohol dehydrogenase n=1 Tax=Flaviaesturariibacter amylovorans TaxID=1084520 RepID=A0ABP8HQ08_9BACT